MLQPKRIRYRKVQRGRMKGKAHSGNFVAFGDYGLQAMEPAWITARQIEAARRAITHHIKRGGNVYVRIFPDKPITKKAAETRMGSGKGAPDHWVAVVKPGRILFEMGGVDEALAKEALRLAAHKLPIDARFVLKTTTQDEETTAGVSANVKIADVKALNDEEIGKQLDTAHKELMDLRFQLATKQLVNHRRLLVTRKTIARLNTVRRQRELGGK